MAKQQKDLEAANVSVYDRNELIAQARVVFNVQPEVVAGALHGVDKQELTLAEAREAVKKFLDGKVN